MFLRGVGIVILSNIDFVDEAIQGCCHNFFNHRVSTQLFRHSMPRNDRQSLCNYHFLRQYFNVTCLSRVLLCVLLSIGNVMFSAPISVGSSNGAGLGLIDADTSELFPDGLLTCSTSKTIVFTQTVTLSGDIEIQVNADSLLTLGDGSEEGAVTIKPAPDALAAQLIFNVAAGKVLEVRVLNSVFFKAATDLPLYVTFRGKGSTVFRMPSGRRVSFGPANATVFDCGVFVQVLMDLFADDVAEGVQQVVFEPWSYDAENEEDEDAVNTTINRTTWIQFGPSSCLRFLSYNATGIDEDIAGYGTIAFDVCHAGIGRMILSLAAGDEPGDAYDAGINIWGALVVGTGIHDAVTSVDLRTEVYANKRAGTRAIMSIIDDVAFASLVTDPENPSIEDAAAWVERSVSDRRGLVVLNNNHTFPFLCANLEGAVSLQASLWATSQASTGYQPGFILADNGQLRIRHNLFLEYIAGATNQALDPEQLAGEGATDSMVKKHNPSALIIDQVGTYGASVDGSWDMAYEGASIATILLEGTAGCFLYCGASAATQSILTELAVDAETGDEQVDATIGLGLYDGVFCPVLDDSGVQSTAESLLIDRSGNPLLVDDTQPRCLDGEHVLDVEGELSIVSVLGRWGFPPNGYMTFPSIRIDYAGREMGKVTV
jgi:hypothetical protein